MSRRILVINAGSSSWKLSCVFGGRVVWATSFDRRQNRWTKVADELRRKNLLPEIIAHRVVHGGTWMTKPLRLRSGVVQRLESLRSLAPLHMPATIEGIRMATRHFPGIEQWGVADTATFTHLPDVAREYALPRAIAKKYHIRKYGFHGISHAYAFRQAAARLQRPATQLSGVTLHLGAGDSMTRWVRGRPVDTTMGFTPLEGLTMSTRSGDLDPMIPLFLQRQGYSRLEVEHVLQHESGIYGLSGLRDMRDVLAAIGKPVPGWRSKKFSSAVKRRARLAYDIFLYDVQRYLAAYVGLNPTTDVLVFTGAIGENADVRRGVLAGVPIAQGIRTIVITTHEDLAIAEAVQKWYTRAA